MINLIITRIAPLTLNVNAGISKLNLDFDNVTQMYRFIKNVPEELKKTGHEVTVTVHGFLEGIL